MYQTLFVLKMQLIISLKSNKHLYLFTSVDFVTNQLPLCSCIPPRKALARVEVNSAGSEHNTSSNNDHHHNHKNRQCISTSSSLALVYWTQMTIAVKGYSILGQWAEASSRFRINVQSHPHDAQLLHSHSRKLWILTSLGTVLSVAVSQFPGI